MRRWILYMALLAVIPVYAQYSVDVLGEGFECRTLKMTSDYDGDVVCTLIRKPLHPKKTTKAVLYVHGFNDYFFQSEMGERFYDEGIDFYAVDLRKYGRSHRPHQSFFMVRTLSEYFADIDTCLSIIRHEGHTDITLLGHSTGGLITGLYAHERRLNPLFTRLIHNSPFYDFNEGWGMENVAIPVVAFLGRFFPTLSIPQSPTDVYPESLLKRFHGEWTYDERWKFPQSSYPACWFTAIHGGHRKLQHGLDIRCPVLVLHSDKSVYGKVWTPAFQEGDAVLSVADIARYAPKITSTTPQLATVPNGLHDLALSSLPARTLYYDILFRFIRETAN